MELPRPQKGPKLPGGAPVPLESIITTAELQRRPSRAPDYEAESRALGELLETVTSVSGRAFPDIVLQKLADTALALCRAHSAGVSILEQEGGMEIFRWRAAAGTWAKFLNGTIPRASSPCGTVLEKNRPILMTRPGRHYHVPGDAPPIVEVLLIPFHCEDRPVGTVWIIAHDPSRRFDSEDKRLMTRLAHFAATAYEMLVTQKLKEELAVHRSAGARLTTDLDELRRTEAALRDAQERLKDDLADSRLLQATSAALIIQDDVEALYQNLLDAAITVMQSDFASMQRYDSEKNGLHLLAWRGFTPQAARFWEWVPVDSAGSCAATLREGSRVTVPDVEACDFMAGSQDLEMFRESGIRACQTTPLLSRNGTLVGMISTHWRQPHVPAPRNLRVLDVLARQAADLIERKQGEEALREADRRKDTFLATLAHELRNPLAPVRNAVQILRLKGATGPELQWAQEVIDRQVHQMTRLVDDLLDISRITRDKLELRKEWIDLAKVLHSAVETSRPFIEECRHELIVELPAQMIVVDADPIRLAQVFANLLNNAAKYSDINGRIVLSARREDGKAVVSVRDGGIGIAPDMQPRVFDLFSQAESSMERGRGGLGVGLMIVKRLAEMHGGSVTVFSEGLGKGSEFVVRLPVVTSGLTAPRKSDETMAMAPVPRRVLVVDDNRDSAVSLGKVLSMLGYDIRTANDGLAGLEAAAAFRPEVAVLDIGMPRMSGYDLARNVRRQAWGKDMLLIAVTGWGQAEDRQRTAEAGFDHHLIKPVDPAELARLLAFRPRGESR